MTIRKYTWSAALLMASMILFAAFRFSIAGTGDDAIFKAMQDEIGRNMSQLLMPGLDKPYFISYTIDDYQNLEINGTLGTLTASQLDRARYLTVDLRVGDYQLDNSNFVANSFDRVPHYFRMPIDNDYDAIRNKIYLATDKLYKGALKDISKKRAYLQTRVINDRPADLLNLPANKYIGNAEAFDIDEAHFDSLITAATRILKEYPMIVNSQLRFNASVDNQYFVNSVGSQMLRGDRIYILDLTLGAKSSDGEDISDTYQIIVKHFEELPDVKKLAEWTKDSAEKMKDLTFAQTVDSYTGPVILDGDASGEFFRQIFTKNISDAPAPLYENDEMSNRGMGPELINKIRRRIMPDFIDIYDDPTITSYNGFKLIGGYPVDDAGNVPARIQIVQKGKLVNLPIALAPTKLISEPNGHARGSVGRDIDAKPSNLIIESSEKVSFDSLKKEMIQLCQDAGIDYGLIIRKMDDLNSSGGGFFGGSGQGANLASPLEVSKLYADGHEELLRNLDFTNVTVRILKDIMLTGDKEYCYNYLIGNDNELPVSIIAPSVLVEEMELKKSEAKIKTPPILPSPLVKK
jgi:TldD protein